MQLDVTANNINLITKVEQKLSLEGRHLLTGSCAGNFSFLSRHAAYKQQRLKRILAELERKKAAAEIKQAAADIHEAVKEIHEVSEKIHQAAADQTEEAIPEAAFEIHGAKIFF